MYIIRAYIHTETTRPVRPCVLSMSFQPKVHHTKESRGYPNDRISSFPTPSSPPRISLHTSLRSHKHCFHTHIAMTSPLLRMRALGACRQIRCFSGTARRNAADVKSLGVVGAGQMVRVCPPITRKKDGEMTGEIKKIAPGRWNHEFHVNGFQVHELLNSGLMGTLYPNVGPRYCIGSRSKGPSTCHNHRHLRQGIEQGTRICR